MKYTIQGKPMPIVVCELNEGEQMITESGAMAWMSPNMKMETAAGGLGKALGRMFSGEKMFQNIYTAEGGSGMITFGSSFVGDVRAIEVTPDKPLILQKSAFLAGTAGVTLSVVMQKRFSAGLLGGEGFILQKVTGRGTVFVEIDGSTVDYELENGQQLVIDTGYLAYADESVDIRIESVKGVKNKLFGGEGFFNTVLTGPGKVTLQTMPLSNMAAVIATMLPNKNG